MRNASKSQIATEYILIMGLVLVVTIPLLYYSMSESSINVQLNQAEDAVNTIAKAADTVYSIGPGTKKYVWINMPGGVQSQSTANKTVLIKLYIFKGISDVFAETKADLTGAVPISKGQHNILVEMLESGYVQIGEANDTIAPIVIWTSPSGTINYNGIILRATTNEYSICKYDENDIGYSIMSNNFVGSALTHEKDIGILNDGNYTYFIRCQDPSGNIMGESTVINFTIVPPLTGNQTNETPPTNETYETDPPSIYLTSPEDNHIDNDGVLLFQYNVTDASSIWFCQLIIDNTIDQTDFEVIRDITQNFTKSGIEYGNHTWNINCSDVHGNRNSSPVRNFTTNHTQDHDLPIVQLISPPDNNIRNYWLTQFVYNVTDITSGIDYCSLNIFGIIEENSTVEWAVKDTPVVENTTESITLPLFKANYTWNVSCVDDSQIANEGYSDTYHLTINISAGEEAFIDSCAGYCGYNGYMDGICRQNAQKCDDYTGGTWESGGDTYCTVQTGDFCCCAQESIS